MPLPLTASMPKSLSYSLTNKDACILERARQRGVRVEYMDCGGFFQITNHWGTYGE